LWKYSRTTHTPHVPACHIHAHSHSYPVSYPRIHTILHFLMPYPFLILSNISNKYTSFMPHSPRIHTILFHSFSCCVTSHCSIFLSTYSPICSYPSPLPNISSLFLHHGPFIPTDFHHIHNHHILIITSFPISQYPFSCLNLLALNLLNLTSSQSHTTTQSHTYFNLNPTSNLTISHHPTSHSFHL
jgi:hypothetical protein